MIQFQKISLNEFILAAFEEPGMKAKGIFMSSDIKGVDVFLALCMANECSSFLIFNQMVVADRPWVRGDFEDVFETVILKGGVPEYENIGNNSDFFEVSWVGGGARFSPGVFVEIVDGGSGGGFRPSGASVHKVKYRERIYEYASNISFFTSDSEWRVCPASIAPECILFHKIH